MTPREVSARIEDLVLWERTKLPVDHPRRPNVGGDLINVRDAGRRAYARLAEAKMLPDAADLEAMVSGSVDVAAYCAKREAESERRALQVELARAASCATTGALRRALDALKGDA